MPIQQIHCCFSSLLFNNSAYNNIYLFGDTVIHKSKPPSQYFDFWSPAEIMLLSLVLQTLQHFVDCQCLCPCFACALSWWQSTQDNCGYTNTFSAQQTFPDAKCKQLFKVNQTKIPDGGTKRVTRSVGSVVSTLWQLCSPHCLISPTQSPDSTTVWKCSWGKAAPPGKPGAGMCTLPCCIWPGSRSVLHATCSALTPTLPQPQWGVQGINALFNGRAQVTQRSSVCQAKLAPSCKELCFCRWEVLSQVRVGPAAKKISSARIQSDCRPSSKPETVSSDRAEPSETYVHKRLIWEGQYRHTSVLARASSAQRTNYLRTSSRQALLCIADQIWLWDSLHCLI